MKKIMICVCIFVLVAFIYGVRGCSNSVQKMIDYQTEIVESAYIDVKEDASHSKYNTSTDGFNTAYWFLQQDRATIEIWHVSHDKLDLSLVKDRYKALTKLDWQDGNARNFVSNTNGMNCAIVQSVLEETNAFVIILSCSGKDSSPIVARNSETMLVVAQTVLADFDKE